ncbi:hypothetical protein BBK82_23410 [Lentzea guizhouensis]|uniref:DUF4062 domain-containing protein n=1 Tax=Lentzea guizhouensis TaxID=1586287 RepID=A0A1B2HLH5_9PSEU|nr:DUF4062 domain-containing protein [Lentzea guizhouensis]ANZ38569.1 hypothetical protein BBK82_23410 [Lentzea guizhouensis]
MALVYVSSTFADLREHREAVRMAIRRLGHKDIAMEHYVAEDVRPVDRCLSDVRSADLYVVVMAWRYGFIPPGHTQSITELEYRAAVEAGIPVLAFVLSEDEPWPRKLMELRDEVEAFRTELLEARIAGVFGSKDDLARQVSEGVQKWSSGTGEASTDWYAYQQAVVERYRYVRLSVIAGAQHDRMARIPLLDVFVSQQLRAGRPNFDLPDEEGAGGPALTEDGAAVLGREPKQVVLGGPGSGKSTLFQVTLLNAVDPVAFLVELREYVLVGSQDFVAFLVANTWEKFGVRVTEAQLAEALKAGATIFFDGLDEIFDRAAHARVINQFHAFTTRFPEARLVVSSRIVGYDPDELGLAGFEHYTLLDFGLKEIRSFVPAWYQHYTFEGDERDAAGLVDRIADNPRLLELAGNPLLLTMMAVLYKHQDLPEKRWKLYERCTDVLLEDWDVKRKRIDSLELLPLGFRLGRDQKAEILQNIAMAMLSARPGSGRELNAIAYEPLRDIIAAYLERQYAKSAGEAQATAVEILNHLRERTFVLAETGEGVFGFVHRTFMEYFVARHVLAEFNRRKADYGWLKAEVYWKHWQNAEWHEPLLLLSAMLAGQGSPIREVVTALAEVRLVAGRPFALRCLGETGTVAAEDQDWAADLVHRMVDELSFIPPKDAFRAEYAADVAAALSSVAGSFPFQPVTLQLISEYRNSSVISNRITGFQLELATAPRSERRRMAMSALPDKDEAVRRAAIAVLDRDSGDEAVFGAFLTALERERNTRVREPLITALDRGWPGRRAVLDAIAWRSVQETSYKHAIWVAKHLAIAWAGDPGARDIVIQLPSEAPAEKCREVVDAVASALVKGWRGQLDFAHFLERHMDGGEFPVKWAAVRTCAIAHIRVLYQWVWDHPEAFGRFELIEVMRATYRHKAVAEWIVRLMNEHPDPHLREAAGQALERVYGRRTVPLRET